MCTAGCFCIRVLALPLGAKGLPNKESLFLQLPLKAELSWKIPSDNPGLFISEDVCGLDTIQTWLGTRTRQESLTRPMRL